MNTRLDVFLVQKGLAETRSKAQFLIEEGDVFVNGEVATKYSYRVKPDDNVEIKDVLRFVSRSGHKLEAALKSFKTQVEGFVCLDIGASTGGFTDCLLTNGASKVYTVDVGNKQLHEKLLNDKRVEVFEDTDFRDFDETQIEEPIDLIVIDVSFISICEIIPNLPKFVSKSTKIIALIKPQFEVGKGFVKKGIVHDEDEVKKVLKKIRKTFEDQGFKFVGEIKSPLKGKEGNQEYLFYLTY